MEYSWIELQRLLKKVEDEMEPGIIQIKRQHLRDDKREYDFNVRTHYRYKDLSILTASVAGKMNVKR